MTERESGDATPATGDRPPDPGPGPRPELDRHLREARRQRGEVASFVQPLDERQIAWRPSADRWSIGQNLVHLTLTDRWYLPGVEETIERGHARGVTGSGPYRHGWIGRLYLWLIEPPAKIRFSAPETLEPSPPSGKEEAVGEFMTVHDRLVALLERGRGLDLGRLRLPSPLQPPLNRWLRLSLGQALRFVLDHNRRHIVQARRVARHAAFPRG